MVIFFYITEISTSAYKKMQGMNFGCVHSIYKNTINISLEKEIISIQPKSLSKTPMSISIENKDISLDQLNILKGQKVDIENYFININNYRFNFKETNLWNPNLNLTINHLDISPNTIKFLHNLLRTFGREGGIGVLDIQSIEDVTSLIGKGIGLTPSGDDFIVGFLSTLFMIEQQNQIVTILREELITNINKSLDKTTFLSQEFLTAACKKEFSEIIHNFYESLKSKDENRITLSTMEMLKLGHSSGSDTLSGIISGLLFLNALREKH